MTDTKTVTLQVSGMIRATSKNVTEAHLARQPGVLSVDANPVSQTATVTYDPQATSVAHLQKWVIECGYHCAGQSVPDHICDPAHEPHEHADHHDHAEHDARAGHDAHDGHQEHAEHEGRAVSTGHDTPAGHEHPHPAADHADHSAVDAGEHAGHAPATEGGHDHGA